MKGLMTKPVDSMSWPIVTTATSRVDPTRMPSMINTSSAGMKLTTPTPPTCANSPMVPRTAAFSRTETMCAGARVWAIRVPPADPTSPFVAFDAGAVPFVGSVTDPREKPLGCWFESFCSPASFFSSSIFCTFFSEPEPAAPLTPPLTPASSGRRSLFINTRRIGEVYGVTKRSHDRTSAAMCLAPSSLILDSVECSSSARS